jgi:hypothetical protein
MVVRGGWGGSSDFSGLSLPGVGSRASEVETAAGRWRLGGSRAEGQAARGARRDSRDNSGLDPACSRPCFLEAQAIAIKFIDRPSSQ